MKIVAYDWLEDSLQAQRHKRESKYDFTVQAAQKAKSKARKAKKMRRKDKIEGEFHPRLMVLTMGNEKLGILTSISEFSQEVRERMHVIEKRFILGYAEIYYNDDE